MQYFQAVQLKTISLTKQKKKHVHTVTKKPPSNYLKWLASNGVCCKKSRIGMKQYFLIYH